MIEWHSSTVGKKVYVTTSLYFMNVLGTIVEDSKTKLMVDFDGRIGVYSKVNNRFIFIEE